MGKNSYKNQKFSKGEICALDIAIRFANYQRAGYNTMPKWMVFCNLMFDKGLRINLYEARRTVSKYITVLDAGGKKFKVRFSDHKPIASREASGDCDFFVGHTNLGVTTTSDAIGATLGFFKLLQQY